MLDSRLNKILQLCNQSEHTLDCGTDHGKLAVELIKSGKAKKVTASDINEMPLNKARELVGKNNLSNEIDAVLADGVADFFDKGIDQIVIAGMGGELIRDIISKADWLKSSSIRMILQPMTTSAALREYLFLNGYNIISENAVLESGKSYEILVVSFDGIIRGFTFNDIEIGDFIHQNKSNEVISLLIKKKNGLLNRLKGAQKDDYIKATEIRKAIQIINTFLEEK